MLFVAETYVYYASEPTDYSAEQAFLFALVDTDGTTVLRSVSLPAWGNKVVGIYQTAAQVTSLGLSSGTAYELKIMGNPVIFGTLTEGTNMVTETLDPSIGSDLSVDWIDQSTATNTANPLRDFIILIAEDLEANDSPSTSYLDTAKGLTTLSTTGDDIFLDGIPDLELFCPIAFTATTSPMEATAPPSTGALQTGTTITGKLGPTFDRAFTSLGNWLGLSQRVAGSLALMVAALLVAFYVYQKSENTELAGVVIILFGVLGMTTGLVPLAAGFVGTLAFTIMTVYSFMGKGAV
jgi:hypothetical protein